MKIGGLQKVTLIDFPAHLAATVFVKGCNFRCPFCFNRDLVSGLVPTISQRTFLSFLKNRKRLLDGVVISGGEPLLQPDLEELIKKIRKLGYKIKLDTNGSLVILLQRLLSRKLLDYVALDIKAPLDENYGRSVGVKGFDWRKVEKSVRLLVRSKTPFELRTTVVPGTHHRKSLIQMARQIRKITGKKKVNWYWQNFQPKNCLDPEFEKIKPYGQKELERLLKLVKNILPGAELRYG